MSRAFVQALQARGVPYTPDFNGAAQAGVGFMQHTIDWATRRRCSAVDAFLRAGAVRSAADASMTGRGRDRGSGIENGRAVGVDMRGRGRRRDAPTPMPR